MKISMVQENFIVGDIPGNYNKIVSHWDKLDTQSDIIIFSELALTGYPAQDLLLDNNFLRLEEQYVSKLIEKSKTMKSVIIIGNTEGFEGDLRNVASVIDNGTLQASEKKYLPNYEVFDEKRYFKSGCINLVTIRQELFLLLVCEDMWKITNKKVNEFKSSNLKGVIAINASPWDVTKVARRETLGKSMARHMKCPVYYVNQIGGQDELIFDGNSFIAYPQGFCERLNSFEPDVFTTGDIPYSKPTSYIKNIRKALVLGIRDYFNKNGFSRAVIGISGGVDSAVVADLAVEALGSENVLGIGMMTEFNSDLTLKLARDLSARLEIEYKEMNISKIIDVFNSELDYSTVFPKLKTSGVPYENLQSRIRGNILMSVSNNKNALVLSTGNKSEISMGYCTLYGDMVGGFNPLKDVYKTDVFTLARNSKFIPSEIVTRPPSAELAEDQLDSDKLPDYDVLDPLLHLFIEENKSLEEAQENYGKELATKVYNSLILNEYKRQQSCPGIKISVRHLGKDRRFPITNQYKG